MSTEIKSEDNFIPGKTLKELKYTRTGKAYCDEICEVDGAVRVSGWALLGQLNEFNRPKRFVLTENRQVIGFCSANVDRPDVLNVIDNNAPLNCGFTAIIPNCYICGDPINDLAIYAESDTGLLLEVYGPAGMIGMEKALLDTENYETDSSVVVDSIHGVALIISTRCNLRCIYCDIHSPYYIEHDMDKDTLESIFLGMKKMQVEEVHFGVMGEPTVHKDFWEIARKAHKDGYKMSIATNFASIFKKEEIETLLNFHTIEISLDTLDIRLLKKIRTGADARSILYNIVRLKASAIQKKVSCPKITLSVVLNEENGMDLPELAVACSVLGIEQCQLLDMRQLDFEQNVPNTLSQAEDKDKIRNSLKEAIGHLRDNNISLSIDASVQDFLEGRDSKDHGLDENREGAISKACLAPWTRVYIAPDGHVTPCFEFTSIGKITPKTPLVDIINSSRMKRLRNELLTGNLNDGCRNCCRAEDTTPEKVRELLRRYTAGNERAETFGQPIDSKFL